MHTLRATFAHAGQGFIWLNAIQFR